MKYSHTAVKTLNILKIKVKEFSVIREGLEACLASLAPWWRNYKEKESKMV